jgi:hypothetical protein
MRKNRTVPAERGQGFFHIGATAAPPCPMLLDAIEVMLALSAPDEPLGPPEGGMLVQKRGVGWLAGERQR